ncbi:nucleoside-diphosphatase [Coprinopsis sp. MPI-PUGE-AT-0042]|nr:nucleoside-diphosphatase [Coprinopsis sp. MPI-PUGE-AT-0042]
MPPPTANDPWLSGRRFGIVIDAGSSGSRLQIYSWKDPRTIKVLPGSELSYTLPKVEKGTKNEADWVKKVEPGLSSLAEHPDAVGTYLQPLIDHALDQIPPSLHHETPIFLLATAGMRLLPPRDQARVLQETCRFLITHTNFKIDNPSAAGPCGSSVRIITGEEEGLFGWIAVNYLMNGFTGSSQDRTTYGFLDMGGASTQIAFEPSPEHRQGSNHLIDVRLRLMSGNEINHKVFVTTWLGYGTNQARERYVGKAIRDFEARKQVEDDADDDGIDTVLDPCLPKGLELVESPVQPSPASVHSRKRHKLLGTGSFEKCIRATSPLLNKNRPCPDAHCLMNGVSVPPIDFAVSHFIGISEYWYSSEHIFGLGGAYNFVQYERAASEFCSKKWPELLKMHEESERKQHLGGDGEVLKDGQIIDTGRWGPEVEIPRLQMQCFKAAWVTNVLHEGLDMPRIVDPGGNSTNGHNVAEEADKKGLGRPAFQSMDSVGDLAITWTLGKMVLEASKQVPPQNKNSRPIVDPIDDINVSDDSPFQPIRPPFLSFAGIEDRLSPHLPTLLSKESLGFHPLRSLGFRLIHSASKRDPYDDLMEEGRVGGGSRPSSPSTRIFSPFRRFLPSKRSTPSRSSSHMFTNGNTYRPPTRPSSYRTPPYRTPVHSPPKINLPPVITASTSQYAPASVISRSSSPAQAYFNDPQGSPTLMASRSRNGSQMSLASLAPRPGALSRVNSSSYINHDS